MTQQQAVLQAATAATVLQIDRRGPERQVLFLAINSLKAAEANLAATHRAVSDDWAAKMTCEDELGKLRRDAASDELRAASTGELFEKITRAVDAGVEPSIRFFDEAEERLGTRFKTLLQDVEFHNRRRAQHETAIPEKERAVSQARHKVRLAALSVIRASSAVATVMNDLEMLQNQVIEKRVQLRAFISMDVVSTGDASAVKKLLMTELPPHPLQPTFENWSAHPAALKWSGALERLMVDADAELPCG